MMKLRSSLEGEINEIVNKRIRQSMLPRLGTNHSRFGRSVSINGGHLLSLTYFDIVFHLMTNILVLALCTFLYDTYSKYTKMKV